MKLKKWKASLPVLIPLALLAAIFAITVTTTVIGWSSVMHNMERTQAEDVQDHGESLYEELIRQFAVLDGYSASLTREQLDDQNALLETLRRCVNNTDFALVCFAYPDGTLYRHDGAMVQVSQSGWFRQAMAGEHTVDILERNFIDPYTRLGMALPVVLEEQVTGVLLGLYDWEEVRELFARTVADVSGLSYICNSAGTMLLGTREAEEYLAENGLGGARKANLMDVLAQAVFSSGSLEETAALMAAGECGQLSYAYNGSQRNTTLAPLGINDWYLVTVLHEDQIRENALGAIGQFYILIFLSMLLMIIIIVYLLVRENRLARQEKRKAEEIRHLLEHDPLTGALSEQAFLSRLSQRLTEPLEEDYCLVYLDIYKFKLINDAFGYIKGNELLCTLARELDRLTQAYGGLVARISGDSFVVFMPHREELIWQFYTKKYREKRIVPLELYLHYGVYVIQDPSMPADRMVDCARMAQKTVKGSYSECLAYYDERLREQIVKEQEIITSMDKALADGEFIVYLQPQYNHRTGAVCGAEALVRWKSPTKGLIPPGDFIPVFETNGFISTLDEYIWELVCKLQRQWLDEGKAVLPLSVNVSRMDLLRGAIAEKLTVLIRRYDLTADLLRVEITESAYMDDPQKLIQEIERLTACGFLVEMDDFGSGYSSLNMLKDVPFHVLKTDMRFLSPTGDESRKSHVLGSTIRMAHEMGMLVIAEGVETREQADYLLSLDCEQMQGYYFSRPLPVEEYERLVYGDG